MVYVGKHKTSTHDIEMVFATFTACFPTNLTMPGWIETFTGLDFCVLCFEGSALFTHIFSLFWLLHFFLIISESYFSFGISSIAFCYHYTLILLDHKKTWRLKISLVSFITVNSFAISAVIAWSIMPFMNCSFSFQYIFLSLLSLALTISLPTYSFADLPACCTSLHYSIIVLSLKFVTECIKQSFLHFHMNLALLQSKTLCTEVLPSLANSLL